MTDDDAGFFRNLSGLATDWVVEKRRALKTDPDTMVDSSGASTTYSFDGQDISFDDLRDIRDMREAGGQVAQLMTSKALLNFGEGAEFSVEDNEETETVVDGDPITLKEWLEEQFPHLDLLVLDLGEDALWYPYAVGESLETRAGEFKKLLPAEPWTLMPVTDERGQVVGWHQRVKQEGGYQEQTLGPDDVWHIVLNKASARDETGISEVLRSKDEIQAFKENEQAINNAIELHGFPQRHIKVGRDDGTPVRDNDLRRVRTIFDPKTSDSNTAYFTGQDVDVETLEAEQFDYTSIHEMDMRNLTTALGLPLEAGNVGSDGLGSGKPAELRFALLKLNIKANQRKFSHQFVDKVIRPIIREYSPFDADAQVAVEIDDPLEDIGEVADLLNKVGDYYTNSEARRMLDLSEPEDDEIAEAYRSPGEIEKSDAGDPVDDSPFGGMFEDAASNAVDSALEDRQLAEGITDEQLEAAPEWDRPLLEMHQAISDPTTPTDKALVSYADSATPEFVLERIREAIMGGAMFSEFDEIPSDRLMDLRQTMADSLTADKGFTLDSITENLMDFEDDLSRDEAERIARTESSAVLNTAREEGYKAKGDEDGLFYWTGAEPGDDRQTDACEWLIEQTNPHHGGTPRPMKELRQMLGEAWTHDDDMSTNMARPDSWVVHINERSTFAKAPPNWEQL